MNNIHTEEDYKQLEEAYLLTRKSLSSKSAELEDMTSYRNILAIIAIVASLAVFSPSSGSDSEYEKPDCEPTGYHSC